MIIYLFINLEKKAVHNSEIFHFAYSKYTLW